MSIQLTADPVLDIEEAGEEAWLSARRTGLTGSDTLAALGLDNRKSMVQLFLEKTEDLNLVTETQQMRMGRVLEPVIAQLFADDTGFELIDPKLLYRSKDRPLLLASPDRFVMRNGEVGLMEIKSTSQYLSSSWDEGPPPRALAQTAHYLGVLGLPWAYVAVLIGGWNYQAFFVERDDALIDQIMDLEETFWHEYVERGQLPPVDESDSTADALKGMWPDSAEGKQIELTTDLHDVWAEFQSIKAERAALEKREKGMRSRLAAHLEDAEMATWGGTPIFSFRGSVQHRIDPDGLRLAHPEIAAAFTKEIPVRTMRPITKVGKNAA